MKYLIMVHTNPSMREAWASFSDSQRAEGYAAHAVVREEINAAGELVQAEALVDPSQARIVSLRDGQILTTDGPFAEAKEQLAGFYLLDARDLNEAIQLAAKIPPARVGSVEVRPVRELVV